MQPSTQCVDLLTNDNENNYSPRVVLDLLMHGTDPLASMNGIRQIATRRNRSVITSTNKDIAVGLMRWFEHSTGCVARSREDLLAGLHPCDDANMPSIVLPSRGRFPIVSQAKGETSRLDCSDLTRE